MIGNSHLRPVESDGDTVPAGASDLRQGDPVVSFTEWMAAYLAEDHSAAKQRMLEQIRGLEPWGDKPVGIYAEQAQAGLYIRDAHGRADMSAVVCKAIEILRSIAEEMGLSDCGQE